MLGDDRRQGLIRRLLNQTCRRNFDKCPTHGLLDPIANKCILPSDKVTLSNGLCVARSTLATLLKAQNETIRRGYVPGASETFTIKNPNTGELHTVNGEAAKQALRPLRDRMVFRVSDQLIREGKYSHPALHQSDMSFDSRSQFIRYLKDLLNYNDVGQFRSRSEIVALLAKQEKLEEQEKLKKQETQETQRARERHTDQQQDLHVLLLKSGARPQGQLAIALREYKKWSCGAPNSLIFSDFVNVSDEPPLTVMKNMAVLYNGQTVLAHAQLIMWGHELEIQYLCARKGHGYGTQLLTSLFAHVLTKRNPPVQQVVLFSISSARGFYRKLGFKAPNDRPPSDMNRGRMGVDVNLLRFQMQGIVRKNKRLTVPVKAYADQKLLPLPQWKP